MFLAHVVKLNPPPILPPFSQFSPFPGSPRGTRWPRWNSDCALDHLAGIYLPRWSITPGFLGSSPGKPGRSPGSHLITWVTADSDHRPPVTTRPNHSRQCLHQTTSKPGFRPDRNDGWCSAEIHDPAKIDPFVPKESFVRMFSEIEPFSEIDTNYL